MAETTDELRPVKRIRALFHPPHRGHLRVHFDEVRLGYLDVERGQVGIIRAERVLVEPERERVRVVVREGLGELCTVRRGLQRADERLHRNTSVSAHCQFYLAGI